MSDEREIGYLQGKVDALEKRQSDMELSQTRQSDSYLRALEAHGQVDEAREKLSKEEARKRDERTEKMLEVFREELQKIGTTLASITSGDKVRWSVVVAAYVLGSGIVSGIVVSLVVWFLTK